MIPVVLRGGMGAKARTAAPARARAATVADGRHRVLPRGRLRLPALDTLFPAAPISVHTQDADYLDMIHDEPAEWNPADYAYHLTRRARGLPLWFSLSVHGVSAYSAAIETAIRLARETTAEFRKRGYLELIREPELGVVLFRRRGWAARQYARWADGLLHDQVAFIPPSAGGRDRRQVRLPASAHADGPSTADPRPDEVSASSSCRPERGIRTTASVSYWIGIGG